MPINSVDVQPRGYRILTGGNDNKVCIWNLLPILARSDEHRPAARPNGVGGKTQKPAEEQKIEIEIDGSSVKVS